MFNFRASYTNVGGVVWVHMLCLNIGFHHLDGSKDPFPSWSTMIILCANVILYHRIQARNLIHLIQHSLALFFLFVFSLCLSVLICKLNGSEPKWSTMIIPCATTNGGSFALVDWSDSPAPAAHAQEAISIREWSNEMNALASWTERLLLHKSTPTRAANSSRSPKNREGKQTE